MTTAFTKLGGMDAKAQGLGGFDFNVHHQYNPINTVLYLGDGSTRVAAAISPVITHVAGVRQTTANTGDDGPALAAQFSNQALRGMAVLPDQDAKCKLNLLFVQTTGGPLIAVAHSALPLWEGIHPPKSGTPIVVAQQFDPSRPATDYDRACNAPGIISTISVGTTEALVLGSFTDTATWIPSVSPNFAGVFVRLLSVDDGKRLVTELEKLAEGVFPPATLQWHVTEACVRLFDSSSSKGAQLTRDFIDIHITPGAYDVETLSWHDPVVAEIVLHRLVRRI